MQPQLNRWILHPCLFIFIYCQNCFYLVNKLLLLTFSMEPFPTEAVTLGVSSAKSGPRQTHSPYRELLTLAPTRSFPPKSRADGPERFSRNGTRDSCAEEAQRVCLQRRWSGQLARVWLLTSCGQGCGAVFWSKEVPGRCGFRDINKKGLQIHFLEVMAKKNCSYDKNCYRK